MLMKFDHSENWNEASYKYRSLNESLTSRWRGTAKSDRDHDRSLYIFDVLVTFHSRDYASRSFRSVPSDTGCSLLKCSY